MIWDFALAALALLLAASAILLYARLRSRRRPRLEVLSDRAGLKAFGEQMRLERERRRDRG